MVLHWFTNSRDIPPNFPININMFLVYALTYFNLRPYFEECRTNHIVDVCNLDVDSIGLQF